MHNSDPQVPPSNQLVAVFGISGVGKSTLIDRFTQEHAAWKRLSVSNLLEQITGRFASANRVLDRTLVEDNQRRLVCALREIRSQAAATNWLLDAHAVIDNDRELIPVDVSVIADLRPTALIFLSDDVSNIFQRRQGDPARRRPLRSVDHLAIEQELALSTCLVYSRALGLSLHRIRSSDFEGFVAAVMQE